MSHDGCPTSLHFALSNVRKLIFNLKASGCVSQADVHKSNPKQHGIRIQDSLRHSTHWVVARDRKT